jgi:hypothetical protein
MRRALQKARRPHIIDEAVAALQSSPRLVSASAGRSDARFVKIFRPKSDIASLFDQSRERLASDGCLYVLFSSDSDLDLLGRLIEQAGFDARLVAERSILFESFIIGRTTRE